MADEISLEMLNLILEVKGQAIEDNSLMGMKAVKVLIIFECLTIFLNSVNRIVIQSHYLDEGSYISRD